MIKRLIWVAAVGALLLPAWVLSAEEKAETTAAASQPGGNAFKSEKERVSYSIGLRIAMGMKQQNVEVDVDTLAKAMKDVFAGGKPLLTDQEAQQVLMEWQRKMREEFQKKQDELGETNKVEGAKFLEENKAKEGVKTLASGVQYKVLKSGDGAIPKATDRVKVHYKGTLIDGTQFDSSIDRGEPAVFAVNGVIKGWTEALQQMKVGDKWQIFIPSDLAYGPRGNMRTIPPNAVLIFDVELLGIEPAEAPPATTQPQ